MKTTLLLFLLMSGACVFADSKTEADLRRQLLEEKAARSIAAAQALEASIKVSQQAYEARVESERIRYGLYSLIVMTLGGIITTIFGTVQSRTQNKATLHATSQIKDTIVTLEKNTNSIKDALVKTTGEVEFARGLKQGKTVKE